MYHKPDLQHVVSSYYINNNNNNNTLYLTIYISKRVTDILKLNYKLFVNN